MGKFHDYIPSNDAEFNNWFKNLVQIVNTKTTGQTPAWTHIPASEVALLTNSYAAWYTAYAPTLKPHTPAETLVKDKAREDSLAVIRPFVGQWLMWKQVTNAEREEAGVHNKKPRRDHIPAPTTVPALTPGRGTPGRSSSPTRTRAAPIRANPTMSTASRSAGP
ncbi:MAG: hypothetical protein LBP23_02450 [Treponema sp.]|jgi:hypothetical protein|nr:hypothetical protein [Treponema sp.]